MESHEVTLMPRPRVSRWVPYAAMWMLWALAQFFGGVRPLVFDSQVLDWGYAIPMLAFPFQAAVAYPWSLLLFAISPVMFVGLDMLARPDWRFLSAVRRYAIFALWWGLSFMLAPSVGMGLVWTGQLSAAELAFMFLEGLVWGAGVLLFGTLLAMAARRAFRVFRPPVRVEGL